MVRDYGQSMPEVASAEPWHQANPFEVRQQRELEGLIAIEESASRTR
jgi:hypothetical protein